TPTIACVGNTYQIFPGAGTMLPATNDVGSHDDDILTTITLPFPVTVYGTPVSAVRAGSNGTVQFIGSTGGNPSIYVQNCLPLSNPGINPPFVNTLFAYYDDLLTVPTNTNTCPGC